MTEKMPVRSAAETNVMRSRNFRLVFFGALVSELGALLYSFAVSFYILRITDNDAFLQGLYLALCGAAMLVFTPVGGVLGDRFHKARIMFLCDYVKGGLILLATVLMLLLPGRDAQLLLLFALGILGNAISGIFTPAASALLPHIVPGDRLQQANSYFTIKSSLESILGVILAGILYAAIPVHTLFFAVGACFVASGVSEMLIRYDHRPSPERLTLRLALADLGDGVRYLRGQKAILAILGAVLFVNFFAAPFFGNFIPYFIRTDLAEAPSRLLEGLLTPEMWSSVFSVCLGLTSLLGAALLSRRPQAEKCGRPTALRLCAYAAVMTGLSLGYWLLVDRGDSLNAFLLLCCLGCSAMGFLNSFINIPMNTALMRMVDRDKLSKVSGIVSIGCQGMIPLASVLAGALLQSLGSAPLLLVCSTGFAAAALMMLTNPHVREV